MSLHAPSVVLAQPQAPYGPHIMTPGPLWVAGAQLLQAKPDLDLTFQDENLRPLQAGNADIVGFNALGAPNFPEIIRLLGTLRSDQQRMLGGQVINSLSNETREQIFGTNILYGNNLLELCTALQIDIRTLPAPEKTSLIPVYERIADEDLRSYLTHTVDGKLLPKEVAFYLSQGCGFNCNFCAAVKNTKERYRETDIIEKDLRFLMTKAKGFGVERLEMYISNLDLFQTPAKLKEFAETVEKLKAESPGFTFGMRGLATTTAFTHCRNAHPDILEAIQKAGLHTLGFGIDGTEATWALMNKKHNQETNTMPAIMACMEHGITPEVLMVIGHQEETGKDMEAAFQITKKLAEENGAMSRPHVWKPLPGSDFWKEYSRGKIMDLLAQDPDAFTAFDVLAAPSPVSHADENVRRVVGIYNERYLALPSNRTASIRPLGWWLSEEQVRENKAWNQGKCDR